MRRIGNIWNKLKSPENISKAFRDAITKTKNRQRFASRREEIIANTSSILEAQNYELFRDYSRFIMYEPKEREVHFPAHFEVNVIHKCLLNVIGDRIIRYIPQFSRANIKNRGSHQAISKLSKFARTHPDWYYFKGDVRKFFDNIDHEFLKLKLRRLIKDHLVLELCDNLIDSYHTSPGRGLPIGNHTSPYFANLFLAEIDHEIVEQYKVEFVTRYMDDIVACFKTKEEATQFRLWFTSKLNAVNLELKNNYRVDKLANGVDFLGYVIRPTHVRLRKRLKNNIKRKTKRCKDLDDESFKQQMASYWGWCKYADAMHLIKSIWSDSQIKLFTNPKPKKKRKKKAKRPPRNTHIQEY